MAAADAPPEGEFQRIERLLAPLAAAAPGALQLRDDAAILPPVPEGQSLVVTTDAMVAGVHFFPDDPPEGLGHKILAVNLSDLAAMGAAPVGYTLTTALPRDLPPGWLDAFVDGLAAMQARFACPLLGGDSVSTPGPIMLSVTAYGAVPQGGALLRSAARPGDLICVSGSLGGPRLATDLTYTPDPAIAAEMLAPLVAKYRRPMPRVALGRVLLGRAHACMDISDGVIGDAGHMARASGVTLQIDPSWIPFDPATRAVIDARPDLAAAALAGGDDYELLFTAPMEALDAIMAMADVPVTVIGRVLEGPPGVVDPAGDPIRAVGWDHYG